MNLIQKYKFTGKLSAQNVSRLSKKHLISLLKVIDAIQQSLKKQIKDAQIDESNHGIPIDKVWFEEVKYSKAKRFEHRQLVESRLGIKKVNRARKNKRRNGGYKKLAAA